MSNDEMNHRSRILRHKVDDVENENDNEEVFVDLKHDRARRGRYRNVHRSGQNQLDWAERRTVCDWIYTIR